MKILLKSGKTLKYLIRLAAILIAIVAFTRQSQPLLAVGTTLARGDIAFTGYITNGAPDSFSFITLVPLGAGTEIYFTDTGWTGTNFFEVTDINPDGERIILLTVNNPIMPGTIIRSNDASLDFSWTMTGTIGMGGGSYSELALGAQGDQITAVQSTNSANPLLSGFTGLAQIDYTGAFEPAVSNGTGDIVPGLSQAAGTAALFNNQGSYAAFNLNTLANGTPAQWRTAIANPTNWTFNATGTSLPTGAATVFTPVSNAILLAAGGSHTCILTISGGVKCWGYNEDGQLGDGTTVDKSIPVDVIGLNSGISAIAAGGQQYGGDYTCALTTGGGVKCWGDNNDGELGDGTTVNKSTPIDVIGLSSGVTAIAAGAYDTCALTTGGGVKCWGDNTYGQLGDGTTVDKSTPVNVIGLSSGVVTIAVGTGYACALTTTGGVKCWGNNFYGKLGDGTIVNKSTPVDVIGLSSGVVTIATAAHHTCALLTSGSAKCWGHNEHGKLGDGTTTDRNAPVDMSVLSSGVAAIAAGDGFTCALTTGGGVKCWGNNYYGQLGDGTTANNTPVDVIGLSSGITAIAAGDEYTCALTTGGGVKCWGNNYYGQLGDGTSARKLTPVHVIGLNTGVTTVDAIGEYTCALTTSGGVKCWGYNLWGQLGDGTTNTRRTPVDVSGLSSGIAAISGEWAHTCALTTGGGVKCWGNNFYGKLGDGTTVDKSIPVDVTGLSSGVAAIAAGGSQTCVLMTSGGVKCWGANGYGQLGDGTTVAKNTPVGVSGLDSGIAVVTSGSAHSCVLTTGGGVKCWGYNEDGELGDGTTVAKSTPIDVTGLSSGVAAIATGGSHTCALMISGGVKCWGYNGSGQLGDGTTVDKSTPVDVIGLSSGVAAIATGDGQTCALMTSGGVKCWGRNSSGELGDGTTVAKSTSIDVTGLSSSVAAIATGSYHTCALMISGGVKCWGANSYGQLGDGDYWRTMPVDVVEAVYPDLIVTDITVQEVGTATCGSVAYSLPRVAKVTVQNSGRAAAGAFVVSLNNSNTQTVPAGLAVGATTVVEFSSGFQDGDNTATVDASAQVQESDENNNSLLKNIWVPVATPIPTCTPTPTDTPIPIPTDTPTVTPTPTDVGTDKPTPTDTATPTPPDPTAKKKWTMLLYLAGDTGRIDGGSVFGELKKAIRRLEGNPNPDVNVVALLDGPEDLDSFRVTFTPQIRYTHQGEVPMDDPLNLVNFVKQAQQDFPAEHYYLVIADHANGVQGIAWDTTTAANKTALLTPAKLEQALKQISNDGADPIDVVHFDGCSFGLLENVAMMHNYVDYLVLSQNIGWSVFGYDQYRATLTATTTPREFALAVAQSYGQTVASKELPYTISAIDTSQSGAAITALNGLADALRSYIGNDAAKRTAIENVRSQSQKFDSTRPLLEITNDDWYVDLVDFATKLQAQALDPQISTTAGALIEALQTGATPLVLYEAHLTASIDQTSTENCVGDHIWQLDNAHGLSIYYPPRGGGGEFTRYTNGDTFTYFTNQSHWDEFLQGGIPPLLPGDPPPDDVMIPLAPCSSTEQTPTTKIKLFLPIVRR